MAKLDKHYTAALFDGFVITVMAMAFTQSSNSKAHFKEKINYLYIKLADTSKEDNKTECNFYF